MNNIKHIQMLWLNLIFRS